MGVAYGFVSCMTIDCPRGNDLTSPFSQLKSQMLQDTSGNYWCKVCSRRCELMDWGCEHHWPAVRVQGEMKYALHSEAGDWFSSIVMASQDMIDALYETLIEQTRAPLDPRDHSEGLERVKAWIDAFEEAQETLQQRAIEQPEEGKGEIT